MIEAGVLFVALILTRVAAFVALVPLTGGAGTPRLVKTGLAVALTVLWGTTFAHDMPACAALLESRGAWAAITLAVIREALIGGLIGYAFGLFMIPARIAGEFLTQELGLSFGNLVNVAGDGMASPLAVLFEMIAAAVFLGLDGHHAFFTVMHAALMHVPVGGVGPELPIAGTMRLAASTEEWGLTLAAPFALCLFLTTVGLTLLARVAPQLNLYSFGLPMRLGVGLVAVLLLLPHGVAALIAMLGHWTDALGRLF